MQTSSSETHPIDAIGPGVTKRPNLSHETKKRLVWWERFSLHVVRASFGRGLLNRFVQLCQRTVGQGWIHHCTKNLLHLHGLERVDFREPKSVLLVANHRSFFDLYVVTAQLMRRRLQKRIVFPVRSGFFYDNPLGLIVNFLMSFFSMYPPLFRNKKKAPLNALMLDELAWLLDRGGIFAGIHPEGTRNKGSDPYSLLPPRQGVGRIAHRARVVVIPVFINGLGNDIIRQVKSNFDGTGHPIHVVFGSPVELQDLLDQPGSPRVYQAIAKRCMDAISALGEEERHLRTHPFRPAA